MNRGPEFSEARENLEKVVIPYVEKSIREKTTLFFEPEHIDLMRDAFADAGVNYELTAGQRMSLLYAEHLRLSVKGEGRESITQVYDLTRPEGDKWVPLGEQYIHAEMFKATKPKDPIQPFEDQGYGTMAALSFDFDKVHKIVRFTQQAALQHGFRAKIGGHDGTEGRGGLRQAIDALRLTFLPKDVEGYDLTLLAMQSRSNTRLEKGILKQTLPLGLYKELIEIWSDKREPTDEEWLKFGSEVHEINDRFLTDNISNPVKKTSSFPPQILPELIRIIATK